MASLVGFPRSSFRVGVVSEFVEDFCRLVQTVGIILLLHVLCKCMVNFALLTLAIFPFLCIYIKINKGDDGIFIFIFKHILDYIYF